MRSLRHWGLIAAFAGGVVAAAQEPNTTGQGGQPGKVTVALAWKLDTPFGQKWETTAKQTITVTNTADEKKTGKKTTYEHKVTMDVTWTPAAATGQDDAKTKKMTIKLTSVTVSSKVTPDSAAAAPPADQQGPATAAVAALKGVEIPVTITRESMKADVAQAELDRVTEAAAGKATGTVEKEIVRAVLARDALMGQIAMALPLIPAVKETPTAVARQKVKGSFGEYTVDAKYEFDKADEGKSALKSSATWTFTPSAAGAAGVKVESPTPAKIELTGTGTFDPAKGLTTALKTGADTKQTFTVKIGDNTYEAVVFLDYSATVTPAETPKQD